MHTLRRYIDLIEATSSRNTPRPIDRAALVAQITAAMRRFAVLTGMRPSDEWARKMDELAAQRLQSEIASYAAHDETLPPEAAQEYRLEFRAAAAEKLWRDGRLTLSLVPRTIRREEEDYQHRAAARHGRADDLDFYIEDSDYLRGMHAMADCARDLEVQRNLADPQTIGNMVQSVTRYLDVWEQAERVHDEGEAPVLDADFAHVLLRLLPLMRAMVS